MLEGLKNSVCDANLELVRRGLVFATWGNASGIDRESGRVVIKPSGLPYGAMRPEDMVVTDLEGRTAEGALRPSVDLAAHLVLYRAFPEIGGIAHTHSHYATCWAQARRPIPCLGTTHADYFYGEVPLAAALGAAEVADAYERHIGEKAVAGLAGRAPAVVPGRAAGRPCALRLGQKPGGSSRKRGHPRGNRAHGVAYPGHQPRGRPHRTLPARQAFPAQTRGERLLRAAGIAASRSHGSLKSALLQRALL